MRGGTIATFVSMLHIIVVSAGWLAKNHHYTPLAIWIRARGRVRGKRLL